jgi:hypothetical protein
MKLSGVALALALGMLAAHASALTTLTNSECLNFSPGAFGIADKIDGTGGGALGVGSGAPYNQDMTDDALICADNHVPTAQVDTAAEFINEIKNTIAHELGHLLGLEHADGNAGSLMNGLYDGFDKTFSDPDEQTVLNDASLSAVQVVWLDFDALQPGLYPGYLPFAQSSALVAFGITPAQVAATIASIVAGVQTDYAGPWTGGATYEFYTAEIDALNATSGNGNYSTISIVAAPEPGTAALVALGLGALSMARWQRRRD